MESAIKTIEAIIKNRVWGINMLLKNNAGRGNWKDLAMKELNGMLICIKNIAPEDIFYCVNDWNNHIEFGYYDENDIWHLIKE